MHALMRNIRQKAKQPTIGKVHAETPRDDGLRVYEICVQAHFARRRRHRE